MVRLSILPGAGAPIARIPSWAVDLPPVVLTAFLPLYAAAPGIALTRAELAISFAQRPNEVFPYWIHDTGLGSRWQGRLAPSLIDPSVTRHPAHLKFSLPEEPNDLFTPDPNPV